MKFSIIIPVYNTEKYLEECIKSVLRQTHGNFEIILVDDGSTDRSGEICDCYATDNENKIRVYHNTNCGPLYARMYGIQKASGDACVFLDADDYIRADALELLNTTFEISDCEMILYNASQKTDFSSRYRDYPFEDGACFEKENKAILYELAITSSILNSLVLKAVKMEIAASIPEYYQNFTGRNGEDLLHSLPMLTKARKIYYLEQNLYYYRAQENSIVHTYNPERYRSVKAVHTELEGYIDLWGMSELHAKHYSREVRGWVECLKQLMIFRKQISGEEATRIMSKLSDDEYFRNAYIKSETADLSKQDAMLARWLYERKYRRLWLLGNAARVAKRIRKFLKR